MPHHREESSPSQGEECDGYNSSSSSPGTPQSGSTSQGGSRTTVPHNSLQEEPRPRPQLADIPSSIEAGLIPRHLIRAVSSPYILQRFLTIESESEPLRCEANIGILEGRVCEGEDMLSKRINEEGWEEVDTVNKSSSLGLEPGSEEGGSFQGTLTPEIYPASDSSSD
ncbi:hypothetical protein EV426DRAFT_381110 [Tirmania nivea]|nr:hypothetical protein EV426DRAFT_381110 [Tirmania nivea]